MSDRVRSFNAGNAGPFTLDGTRTYLVGAERVAIIDPGPDVQLHVRALLLAVERAQETYVLLTHDHPDHAAAARRVAESLGASVFGPAGASGIDRALEDGEKVDTDDGPLLAVDTPGHTRHHLCFHWPDARALFAGDLILGRGDTTWVAEYPGCVADYFASLERLRDLPLDVIYPTHGPPLENPAEALDRFERHRRVRVGQVERAMASLSDGDVEELMKMVYGDTVPEGLHGAAMRSLAALVEYVKGGGRA